MFNWKGALAATVAAVFAVLHPFLFTQTPGPEACGPLLAPGSSVEDTLQGGETRSYAIRAERGAFIHIEAQEQGVNLVLRLLDSQGKPPAVFDTPGDDPVTESFSLLGDDQAIFCLEVAARSAKASPGTYSLRVSAQRPGQPDDRRRIQAEQAEAKANQLYAENRSESWQAAFDAYQEALRGFQEVGDTARQAASLYRMGRTRMRLQEHAAALDHLEKARGLYHRLEDRSGEAAALNQLGRCYMVLDDDSKALQAFQDALALWQRWGLPTQQAVAHSNLAALLQRQGRYAEARSHLTGAAEAFRQSGQHVRQAAVLNILAEVEQMEGLPLEALGHYREAQGLAEPGSQLQAWLLHNLGRLHSRMGEKQEALELYQQSLALADRLSNRRLLTRIHNNLGSLYLVLGLPESAAEHYQQALQFLSSPQQRRLRGSTLINLGRAFDAQGRPEQALQAYRAALEVAAQLDDRVLQATGLKNLGDHQLAAGEPHLAVETLRQSLQLNQQLQRRSALPHVRRSLGLALASANEAEAARREFSQALDLSRQLHDPEGEAESLREISRLAMQGGELDAARSYLEQALQLIETQRLQIAGDQLRSSYFATLRQTYQTYVDLLMRLHRRNPASALDVAAFQAAERSRARSLLDVLRQAHAGLGQADRELLQEEQSLRRQINALADYRIRLEDGPAQAERSAQIEELIQSLLDRHRSVESRLAAATPPSAGLQELETVGLKELQSRLLDEQTLVLEYFLAPERSYLWAVTPSAFESFELAGNEQIEPAARQAHQLLGRSDPDREGDLRGVLAGLSRMLLQPAASLMKGRRLVIVADGLLHYLPLSALPLPDDAAAPLVTKHEVVYLPSLSVLPDLRRRAARAAAPDAPQLAILADPVFQADDPRVSGQAVQQAPQAGTDPLRASGGLQRLPWSRQEAQAIAAQAGQRSVFLALDFEAGLQAVSSPLFSQSRFIHLATHGLLDSRNPELSGLVFSLVDAQGRPQPGTLRLPDIYNLRLQADLVVLSGCRTALGKYVRGEGLVGVTRGFLFAGASQVMASLWPVRDRAAAVFAGYFYGALLGEGLSAPAALRKAQIRMRGERRWRDPHYWAAFVLQGDWLSRDEL